MPKKSISEIKFALVDWLLDMYGLDADDYTDKIQKATNLEEVFNAVTDIRRKIIANNPEEGTKFFAFWTALTV